MKYKIIKQYKYLCLRLSLFFMKVSNIQIIDYNHARPYISNTIRSYSYFFRMVAHNMDNQLSLIKIEQQLREERPDLF